MGDAAGPSVCPMPGSMRTSTRALPATELHPSVSLPSHSIAARVPGVTVQPEVEAYAVTEAYRGARLDRFLQAMLPRMSRAAIQQAIGCRVRLASGSAAKAARRLVVGEVVTIAVTAPVAAATFAAPKALARGAFWIVVDKPAGVRCTPSSRDPGNDLTTQLCMAPAHRLDRFTSGCLLLTGERGTARAFDLAFRAHSITKTYVAVVEGRVLRDQFAIDAPLGRDPRSRIHGKVGVDAAGVAASTWVEVLARADDRTLLRLRPRTGRRHQLRAHLAHVGHPIVGDLLYGRDERQFVRWQRGQPIEVPRGIEPGRHLLHAHSLAFREPMTAASIEVEAPWPADFGFVTPI